MTMTLVLSSDGTASSGPVQLRLTRLSMQASRNECVLSDVELKVQQKLLNLTPPCRTGMFEKYESIDPTL